MAHAKDIQLGSLDKEGFLVIAIETALRLKWNIDYICQSGFKAHTQPSINSWSEEIIVKIRSGTARIKSESTNKQLIGWGKNRKNIKDFIWTFDEVEHAITTEEIKQKTVELRENYTLAEDTLLNKPPVTIKEKAARFLSIFKPTNGYFVTPIIIDINILIFILMAISGVQVMHPDQVSLVNWGANFKPVTLDGQWWRLLTACFLHVGIGHLLMNMLVLFYIGFLLEPFLGKARFIAVYLLTGVASNLSSLWWNDLTVSVGASGAILGMFGVFLALLTTKLMNKQTKEAFREIIIVFIGYNLLSVFGISSGNSAGVNVDNAAHVGGLVSGIVAGYALVPSLKKPELSWIKFSTIGILTGFVLIFSFYAYKSLPNDYKKYSEAMHKFDSNEFQASRLYNSFRDTSQIAPLLERKDKAIFYWNENIKITDEIENMKLPKVLKGDNLKLKEYCKLNIKYYEFAYKSVNENTDMYKKEISHYKQKMNQTNSELSKKRR